jgi:capsular polysaccharide transport system ATP-binding protein
MIRLHQVGKRYPTRQGPRDVLRGVNLELRPGERIGILGRNGSGKSTLVRLLGGTEMPSSGHIERRMSVSWPLAFGGGFQSSLTGLDNLRFVCRVYGASYAAARGFVEDFSELGAYLREPVRTYSSGMRARLAFALSMAVEFDCFLVDEVVAVGDARFHEKCHRELFERRGDRAMVLVSHEAHYMRAHCSRALVLVDGVLHGFDSVDAAYAYYQLREGGAS